MDAYVQDIANLAGFQFTVAYDPAIVQAQNVTLGTLLTASQRSFTPLGPDIDNLAGRAAFGAYSLGDAPAPGGSGSLANITFSPVAPGTSTLTLTSQGFTDPLAQALPITTQDGSLTIRPGLPGDVNCDCTVDIVDIMLVAGRWGGAVGDPLYDAHYDQDADGDIDVVDIMLVVALWNTSCSNGSPSPPETQPLPGTSHDD